MGELRIVKFSEMNAIKLGLRNDELYFKSEVDKLIAELKKENEYIIENTAEVINAQDLEIRHQKYKRCLAMAEWCFTKSNYHFVLARHGEDVKENHRRDILYIKWNKRWLEIAEEFKR